MNYNIKARSLLISFATGISCLLLSMSAKADCTSPTAVAGQLMLVSGTMEYCAGTAWRALNNTNTGTACSPSGLIQYTSSQIMWCNGSTWLQSAPTLNYGACAAGSAGNFYYDSSGTYYWFCNGANWRRMGP